MKPYPWRERRSFHERRVMADVFDRVGVILFWPALIMSLGLNVIAALWARRGFTRSNDSYWRRGAMIMVFGLVLMPFCGGPVEWFHAAVDLLYSFGKFAEVTWQVALRNLIIAGIPMAFILQGIASITSQHNTEYAGERFILATRPTFAMRRRFKRNSKKMASGANAGDGWLQFGVIADDPIPWRTARHGMIVERPIERIGHGVIVGGNGTGKTVLASNLVYQAAASKAAVLYIDFKASLDTYLATKAAARAAGVPFYSFDLGIGSGETTWYDPLAWDGTPSDKASMLVQSFNFSDSGDSSHYKNLAEYWLTLQIEVMDYIGLREGESRFNFLLDTATPAALQDRINVLRGGSDYDINMMTEWGDRTNSVKAADLSGLRANLSTVVNSGGQRLVPQTDTKSVSLARIAEEGGVIYIGLSPSTNEVALRIIGSLVLRDLGVLAGERMRVPDKKKLRPMIAFVDEASRMGQRAVVMDNLFATSREGLIALWPITQSFSTWPISTQVEMNTNVQTHVTLRVQDPKTAELLASTLEPIQALQEMREVETRESLTKGSSSHMTDEGRQQLVPVPFIAPGVFGSMDNYFAYVWFSGSRTFATRKKWKSRRVRDDQVKHDAPLVRIIAADLIMNPVDVDGPAESFNELVSALPSTSKMAIGAGENGHDQMVPNGNQGFADSLNGFTSNASGQHGQYVADQDSQFAYGQNGQPWVDGNEGGFPEDGASDGGYYWNDQTNQWELAQDWTQPQGQQWTPQYEQQAHDPQQYEGDPQQQWNGGQQADLMADPFGESDGGDRGWEDQGQIQTSLDPDPMENPEPQVKNLGRVPLDEISSTPPPHPAFGEGLPVNERESNSQQPEGKPSKRDRWK